MLKCYNWMSKHDNFVGNCLTCIHDRPGPPLNNITKINRKLLSHPYFYAIPCNIYYIQYDRITPYTSDTI